MFKELMPVIQDRAVTITIALLKSGRIKVCVVPQSHEKDGTPNKKITSQTEVAKIPDKAMQGLTTPLAITGTPEELDANLPEALTKYAKEHGRLQHGIEQATQEIQEALKALEERRKSQAKPSAKKTTTSQQKQDTPKSEGAPESDQDAPIQRTKEPAPTPEVGGTLPLSWCAPTPAASNEHQQSKPSNTTGSQS